MKRLFLVLASIFCTVVLSAQTDSEKMAARAFAEEEYADAVELYKAAIALTSDAGTKSSLEKKLSNARTCLNTRSQAAKSYSEGKYTEALELYTKLSKLNPKDSQVRKYLPLLQQRQKDARRAAEQKKRMQKIIEQEYKPALQGTTDQMKAFAARYPDTHEAYILSNIVAIDAQVNTTNRDDILLEIGKEYLEYGLNSNAGRYLKQSAFLGNPEALYTYAKFAFTQNSDAWLTLMALSAEGGHAPAAESLKGGKNYSRASANRMYNHLIACRSSLESARYVKTNAKYYYLDVDVSDVYMSMLWDVDLNNTPTYDLYDMAETLLPENKRKKDLYRSAAYRGNVDAMYRLATLYPSDSPQDVYPMMFLSYYYGIDNAKEAFSEYLFYNQSDILNFKAYMKYILSERNMDKLRSDNVRLFDALLFITYDLKSWCPEMYDVNDRLLLYCTSPYYDKDFWKQNKSTVWDVEMLGQARYELSRHINSNSSGKMKLAKKMYKKLEKAHYDKERYTNPLAAFLKKVRPETLHRQSDGTQRENIFGLQK